MSQFVSAILPIVLVFIFISFSFTLAHRKCGTSNPSKTDLTLSKQAELLFFGKSVNDIQHSDVSPFLQSIQTNGNRTSSAFRLTGIPIVFHILSGQNSGSVLQPSMTLKQARWTTTITNKLYRIYDKKSKGSVQFASFKFNPKKDFIVHSDIMNKECYSYDYEEYRSIVRKASEWEFKMHVIVCESNEIAGSASFPTMYEVTDERHNMILLDHRAVACQDDNGNFLCDLSPNGTMTSKTIWFARRSVTVAHEFGHLLGLYHTFQGGCSTPGDGVFDTPTSDYDSFDCSGLLPYNKDRNLYYGIRKPNVANESSQCGGEDKLCGNTCAACCNKTSEGYCAVRNPALPSELITEDETDNPVCCSSLGILPRNSCPSHAGIDPLNNVMSYAADYCIHEFTVGQMMKMMALIKSFKSYMYCNYATIKDEAVCSSIPCSTTATSPNCV